MDEPHEQPDGGEALEAARQSLRILQVHASHQKKAQTAREKLSADVRTHLDRIGAPPTEESEWPALASAQSIVSGLPPTLQDDVLAKLPEDIREQMVELLYAFSSIPRQTPRAIQKLIQTVEKRTLATALIGSDETIHEAIVTNMSKRAATMLDEDIESLVKAGELSTRDLREAREEVSAALYKLHETGELGGQPNE
jgi:flagellar motor switch protein FliG